MFTAFDEKQNKIISASSVKRLGERYQCSTEGCKAKMLIRSIDGSIPPHFYKSPSSEHDHSFNCKCIQKYGKNKKFENSNIDINTIFNKTSTNKKAQQKSSTQKTPSHEPKNEVTLSVSTPKNLLAFGISHDLSEMINNNQTLHDIFIDDRNCYAQYSTVDGIKMIVGKTIKYSREQQSIICCVKSKENSNFSIELIIYFPKHLQNTFNKVIKYIFENSPNKTFSKFPIAILGDWKTIQQNQNSISVETQLKLKSHIIYTHI